MKFLLKLVSTTLAATVMMASFSSAEENKIDLPAITESFVMLYYKNLDGPKKFYGEILGLKETMASDGFRLFRLTPTSLIGAIKSGSETAYHVAQEKNAVMLSIVTDDVDGWYNKLKANKDIKFLKELSGESSAPIRAFLIEDPGGYTVEFFEWASQ